MEYGFGDVVSGGIAGGRAAIRIERSGWRFFYGNGRNHCMSSDVQWTARVTHAKSS